MISQHPTAGQNTEADTIFVICSFVLYMYIVAGVSHLFHSREYLGKQLESEKPKTNEGVSAKA